MTAVNTASTDTLLFRDENCTVMRRITTFQSTMDRMYDGGKNFLETLDKLIVEENFQNKFSIWMIPPYSERTFIYKESNSMPGFKIYVSTLCDILTTTKLPYNALLRMYLHR